MEYPGNWHELMAWFPDNGACLRYLERLRWGETPNRIATDLGISRGAVAEILEQLRAEGAAEAPSSGN